MTKTISPLDLTIFNAIHHYQQTQQEYRNENTLLRPQINYFDTRQLR